MHYQPILSFKLSKKLTKILSNIITLKLSLASVLKTAFSIKSLFKYKDSLTDELCSNIIYKSRIRFYQHLGMSSRTNRPVSCPTHSSSRNHCHNGNHPFSINQFPIIDSTNNEQDLRKLESLYINPLLHSVIYKGHLT